MDYLIFFQTIFYATFSLAILIMCALLAVALFYLIRIASHARRVSENIESVSEDVRSRIEEFLDALASLPIISMLLRKRKPAKPWRTRARKVE